jgi:hypothetical protein
VSRVHLEVDPSILDDTASGLRQCVDLASDVARHRGMLTELVDDCGSNRLRSAAEHFIGRWGYGMRLVVDDAEALAGQLQSAADTYRWLEAEISRELR